ncbi:MAG: S-adenosylmethionine:tRNA ribosyltransferase-isomerase, partial [Bacteroidota bacterium]
MAVHNDIDLKDYTYSLPEERIAKFPLANRSNSKVLLYKNGDISEDVFKNIGSYIPSESTLFFNNTRVIPARLHFYKYTGAHIEIFLLEPILPTSDVPSAMLVKGNCSWKCMIGNLKKWKDGQTLELPLMDNIKIQATI